MICTVAPVYDLDARALYLALGAPGSEKRRGHEEAGTDRLGAGTLIDAPSLSAFVAEAERLTAGRRVKAQGIVISAPTSELDATNEDDQRLIAAITVEALRRAYPGALIAVIPHGDGGAAHAHALVVNDLAGRAIRENRTHWALSKIVDEVTREHGLSVIDDPQPKIAPPEWAARRDEVPSFDRLLGDTVADVLGDETITSWAALRFALEEHGVTVEPKLVPNRATGEIVTGLTFKMLDTTGEGKPRIRRRKASSLGAEFTHAAIVQRLAGRVAELTIPQAAQHVAVVPGRTRGDLVGVLTGVLASGLFAVPGLPGYARAALKVGVTVARAHQRTGFSYAWADSPQARWHETELPVELSEDHVRAQLAEAEIIRQQIEEIEAEAASPRRRRRAALPDLPPAAQRHAEAQRLYRERGARALGD
ncbi:hypothetical protein ACIPEQ_06720 [Curtobacterium sp. NPDC087080]|uniref:hypothetical protein n=1 Tax=unclassified Curtobacterium TaxID=257496 RepID=UPI003816312E